MTKLLRSGRWQKTFYLLGFLLFPLLSTYGQELKQMTTEELLNLLSKNNERQLIISMGNWTSSQNSKEASTILLENLTTVSESQRNIDEKLSQWVIKAQNQVSSETSKNESLESLEEDFKKMESKVSFWKGATIAVSVVAVLEAGALIIGGLLAR